MRSRQSIQRSTRERAGTAAAPASAADPLVDSPRLATQRRQLAAAFGEGALGLVSDAQEGPAAQGVAQRVKWDDHGAKKFNSTWYFKEEGTARTALAALLGASAEHLKEDDWALGIKFATDRDEGADSALKLMHGTAEENLRKARVKARKDEIDDAGLLTEIDDSEYSAIGKRALKLGVSLYIEGNLNGGIAGGWSVSVVNGVIDEFDGENFEAIGIHEPEDEDTRTGIVIRDVHKATNKTAQGKGSVYRASDTQANINMKVLGKLVQVHLNVG